VTEHHQGALDAFRHVDALDRSAVHLRVGPHGGDQVGDATGRLLHLGEQGGRGERARHPFQSRLQRRVPEQGCRALAPGEIGAGGGQRRSDQPVALDVVPSQPGRDGVLVVGHHQRVQPRHAGLDLQAQVVEPAELRGRDVAVSETPECREQRRTCAVEGTDRAGRRGGRVVDLMCETGGERAEGDQRVALSRRGLDRARGAVQTPDEVPAEGEPRVGPLPQRVGRHPEHPSVGHSPARREIDAVLVPGPEPAGPTARHIHSPHLGLLAADAAPQGDGTVDEHPPEVGRLALAEQVDIRLDAQLRSGTDQFPELDVRQAVEEAETAYVVELHQIVVR